MTRRLLKYAPVVAWNSDMKIVGRMLLKAIALDGFNKVQSGSFLGTGLQIGAWTNNWKISPVTDSSQSPEAVVDCLCDCGMTGAQLEL